MYKKIHRVMSMILVILIALSSLQLTMGTKVEAADETSFVAATGTLTLTGIFAVNTLQAQIDAAITPIGKTYADIKTLIITNGTVGATDANTTSGIISKLVNLEDLQLIDNATTQSSSNSNTRNTTPKNLISNKNTKLKSVTLKNVTTIDTKAFSGASSMTALVIPSVTSVTYSDAFTGITNLTSITLGATPPPATAGPNSFPSNAALTFYVPADKVATYKADAVWSSAASRIKAIGDTSGGVVDPPVLDGNAVITFNTTGNLLDLLAAAGYDSTDPVKAASLKTVVIKAGSAKKAFANADFNPSGKSFSNYKNLTSFTIEKPADPLSLTWNGNKLPNNAFKGLTSLKQVKIGIDTSYIGTSAFEGCTSLETAEFGLTRTLGPWAFKGDISLKSITFNKTYLPIGLDDVVGPPAAPGDWFYGVNINNLIIYVPTVAVNVFVEDEDWSNIGDNGITIMSNGDNAPEDTGSGTPAKQNVVINTFTSKALKSAIDNSNFTGNDYGDIKVLTINDGNLDPADCTFIAANLKKLEELYIIGTANFVNGTIPKNAFEGNKYLKKVKADNVTVIGAKAFNLFESLTEVNFPNVTTISSQAFAQTKGSSVSKLTTARFPKVQVIEQRAFYFCMNLKDLYLGNVPPTLTVPYGKQGLWFNFVTDMTVHVPSLAVYKEYIKLENSDQIDWSAMTFVADNGDALPVIPPAEPYVDADYNYLRVNNPVPYYDGDYKLSLNMYTFNMNLNSWLQGRTSPVPMTTLDTIRWAHDNGFDAVDITCYYIPGYSNTDMPTPEQQVAIHAYAKQIKELAGSLGIAISGTGIQNNFADPNQARRDVDIERIKFWTQIASEMGAPVIRVFAGPPPVDIKRTGWAAITRDRIVPSIQQIADFAAASYPTVQIGIQNHGDMLATANQVLQLVKWVNRPNVGVVNDTGYYRDFMNVDATQYDWYKDISLILPYSNNFQVKKKPAGAETTELMDLNKLFGIIRNSPYRGYIPVELLWLPNDDGYPGNLDTPPYNETSAFLQSMRTAMRNTKLLASVGASDLSGISLSSGMLNETFTSAKTSYTQNVLNNVTSLTITPMVAYASASVTVNGTPITTSQPSAAIPLNLGLNTIPVVVTAADGSTKTYTINVTRQSNNADLSSMTLSNGSLSPAFASGTIAYTSIVGNGISSLTVTANVYDNKATMTVNGNPVISGQASGAINLNVGSNTIHVVVTAENGTTKTYSVVVNRVSGGSSSGGSAPIDTKVTGTEGKLTLPAGKTGEVSLGNKIVVSIPANATDKELKLTIEQLADTQNLLANKEVLVSSIFEILKSFPENFSNPVTLIFTFDPGSLKNNQTAAVFYYDEGKKVWVEVTGSKINGNQITAEVNHFTKFAVFAVDQVTKQPITGQPTDTKSTVQLSDIAGHWSEANIKQAVSKGIVNGYPDGTFKPNHTVTRAEFAVMLMNTLKPQGDGATLSFIDAARIGTWAQKAVSQAFQANIIKGYEDGSFRPEAEITRAEMAVMIANALGLVIESDIETGFADDKDVPVWSKGAVAAMKKQKLVEGKGGNEFGPAASTTRAEAVTVLLNMLAQKRK
ncbi:S-layer homology domain-containing protein [Paenibacillus radicis (ex Xue et al. 2023)]|uniref:S-layer homology domain-containing protein n=1 Tax=Paenibacillus radicis (ex Xue et al. 2023) TaxID=2972489 RepID=A0ABT1YUW0_9BACL|nr:S-layer homology domain-containing protein [Paenibacillus radicis (ex Xue et al. 2023)]MCR8636600.1 S-layer homology domain-containing protein [Paenibacillus radicis (ex Xue et al. 2023)]